MLREEVSYELAYKVMVLKGDILIWLVIELVVLIISFPSILMMIIVMPFSVGI